ncbi:MAG: cbb3-type cytochrome c oxidase subunit I [Planctomycetia bacterium]|nr:cbb3-type cytochrome c oxidase subunit I [Planctomycetia bacterium]
MAAIPHAHDDAHAHAHEHGREMSLGKFLTTYVFSFDHKVIGLQFLFSTLIWFSVGGLLALGVRWQLAWPWTKMPIVGDLFFSSTGGQISPEFYTMLFTMHASIMIFFVIIPILAGAFGNFLIPLMIGAEDMAFPVLNMMSYWFMWPAFLCMIASFFVEGGASAAGWTGYPPLSSVHSAAPASHTGQTLWVMGLIFVGVSSMMGSVNYMTTIIQMRAPGMTMFRMPMTIWGMFITAILQAFALPVLTAALFMQLMDRTIGTSYFIPEGLIVNGAPAGSGGGQPLLWQHLFWFYSHPAVYIMILPAMGMVSDMISTFARKPLFGYKPMIYSIAGIAGLGFIVWGHHMFMSGMSPWLGTTFMVSTIMIALPSAIKVFNWLATIWAARIQYTTAMLFALSFVSLFIIGGLSGIFMAATPVDIFIHDTYFIVAHIHYVLFGGSAMGIFGGIYFWFPKMFGRMMNEFWGKVHFFLTFIFFNGTFYPMHILGAAGFPRRLADPYHYETFQHLLPMNQFITVCAIGMGASQIILAANMIYSLLKGPKCGRNPWHANSLEWTAPSPPGHGNFDFQPVVYRGPYEYASPLVDDDYFPQTRPPVEGEDKLAHH